MADDATPTTTPADDGRAHVTPNGKIHNPRGGRVWVWCQDDVTGHRYDVASTRLPLAGVKPVAGYRLNRKPLARPAKTRLQWEADDAESAVDGAQDVAPVADQAAPDGPVTGDDQAAAGPVGAVGDLPVPEPAGSGDEQAAAAATDGQQVDGKGTTTKGRTPR